MGGNEVEAQCWDKSDMEMLVRAIAERSCVETSLKIEAREGEEPVGHSWRWEEKGRRR